MTETNVVREVSLPFVSELNEMAPRDFISFFLKNKNEIDSKLISCGAVKFSGVCIESLEDFQLIVDSISSKFLSYVDGNSPRTKLSQNVYTSTEFDQTQRITMHNEFSYSSRWPNKLFFSCIKPADTGGETLLVDSREVLIKMDKSIVAEIEKRGIMYIRNLHGGMGIGIGPSWQETFETNDKNDVESYCRACNMDFEWTNGGNLKLRQRRRGIIEHRISGEKVWFNQIDQFHPYHLEEEIYETMKSVYYSSDDFPTYVTFGDGRIISENIVAEITNTINELTIAPIWKENELLLVDNELVGHGRNPFTGVRRVLVAMSE
jgi:hypothetical protein